jgi:hypothetical protein
LFLYFSASVFSSLALLFSRDKKVSKLIVDLRSGYKLKLDLTLLLTARYTRVNYAFDGVPKTAPLHGAGFVSMTN